MDLKRVEKELKKRLSYPYSWGRKQSDDWDKQTDFIYETDSFESLLKETKEFNLDLKYYALNRWFNYWSAKAVEYIFSTHTNVYPNENSYDKLVDFKINDISFDHKTSVFPKGFNNSFDYAQENKNELIEWFYSNQSQQRRKHLKNRLFIVLFDNKSDEHWKLKAEIPLLKDAIDNYMKNYSKDNLSIFDFGEGKVFSDIIWVIKK